MKKRRFCASGDGADIMMDVMSRQKLNPPAFVLLAMTLGFLFVTPMPISLFKVLSVKSTFVLLIFFEMAFTWFFLGSFRPRFEVLMVVSIAYGGLLWSSASNWISVE